jgi:hypothetical protein
MRTVILVLAALGLAACVDTHAVERPMQISKRIAPTATAYVSVPPDATMGAFYFVGSGQAAADAVAAAFARHMPNLVRADAPQTLPAALEQARAKNAAYLIAPGILRWEDWNTRVSGKSDQVELEIAVIEVATGQIVERGVVKGTNGIPDNASERPQLLLPLPVGDYVDTLFLN